MRRTTRPTLETREAREQGLFNIGQASDASGVSAKMIRHYEKIGVIPAADRTVSNYRVYSQSDVHTLQFVRRARDLGFSMKRIQELLGLWQQRRSSREVRKVALSHVAELDTRIREMEAMKRTLEMLASHCHGDDRPECPILDDLAGEAGERRQPIDEERVRDAGQGAMRHARPRLSEVNGGNSRRNGHFVGATRRVARR